MEMEEHIVASKSRLSSLFDSSPKSGFKLLSSLDGTSTNDFTARLKSYRRWTSKPVEVSPWWCSRYGWFCVETDLLQCVGCRQYLSAHLPSAADDAILRKKAVDRLRGLLKEAHTKSCVWRSDFTGEETCAPNVTDYEWASIDFSNRLRSMSGLFSGENEKRYLILSGGFDEKVTEEELNALVSALKTSDLIGDTEFSRDALVVTMLGWNLDRTWRKECISCDYCLRRLGLWMFRANATSEVGENSVVTDVEKGQQRSPKPVRPLDPIYQHHKWCPWVMAALSSSVLFVNSRDIGESSEVTYIPAWLACFRLLASRGLIAESADVSSGKDTVTEHYALARQLLAMDDTLEFIEVDPGQADTSTTSEETFTI